MDAIVRWNPFADGGRKQRWAGQHGRADGSAKLQAGGGCLVGKDGLGQKFSLWGLEQPLEHVEFGGRVSLVVNRTASWVVLLDPGWYKGVKLNWSKKSAQRPGAHSASWLNGHTQDSSGPSSPRRAALTPPTNDATHQGWPHRQKLSVAKVIIWIGCAG